MRDDGGGGGGGNGTPWYMMSIEDMWQWVNRDLSPHYQQANSWKKTSELYGLYQSRLQAFRDKLAIAWNPKNSKASEAYLTRLDELIKAVKDVDEVAGRNYQAAVDIPNAIAEAKYKLKPIYDKYKAAAGDFTGAGGSSTGGSYASTSSSSSEEAKEAAGIVNQQHYAAQSVMYTLSSDLSASRTGLGKPAPYAAPQRTDGGGDYPGGGTVPPPVIPPVVPSMPPGYPTNPPGPTQPMPQPKGPDLSGLQPAQPTPTQPTPFTPTPPTTPPGTPPVGTPPGGIIKPPPQPGPGGAGVVKPPVGPRPPGTGLLPPGTGRPGLSTGLIGGAPPAGGGRGGVGGARPNPVGGMIGGASAGAGRGGVGAPGTAGAAGVGGRGAAAGRGAVGAMGAGGRAVQGHDEDGEHFDPDTAWDVAQGGAPVLDAPEAQRPIDPGPAIGLSR